MPFTSVTSHPTGFSASPPPASSPSFGVVVSGCPVRTDFVSIDASKVACRLTCPGDVVVPLSTVTEICIFLLQPLPPDKGVMCYWQLASAQSPQEATGFELLGALSNSIPSQIFYTSWGENEHVVAASSQPNLVLVLTIGLSLEPLSNISNVLGTSHEGSKAGRNGARAVVAQHIAKDLYSFMQSFDDTSASMGVPTGSMLVPNNIFDRWMRRFESRLRHNPNFFLKDED